MRGDSNLNFWCVFSFIIHAFFINFVSNEEDKVIFGYLQITIFTGLISLCVGQVFVLKPINKLSIKGLLTELDFEILQLKIE